MFDVVVTNLFCAHEVTLYMLAQIMHSIRVIRNPGLMRILELIVQLVMILVSETDC